MVLFNSCASVCPAFGSRSETTSHEYGFWMYKTVRHAHLRLMIRVTKEHTNQRTLQSMITKLKIKEASHVAITPSLVHMLRIGSSFQKGNGVAKTDVFGFLLSIPACVAARMPDCPSLAQSQSSHACRGRSLLLEHATHAGILTFCCCLTFHLCFLLLLVISETLAQS